MPKELKSVSLLRRSKQKGSPLGRRLVAGLKEALSHARRVLLPTLARNP
jgi:hypothetical protein